LRFATRERWADLVRGRPVEKAWLYEIVANGRSGLDVDKCDYFRRDAHYLGIRREFDHRRFLFSLRVIRTEEGLPLLAAPEKDCDFLRDNALETRLVLHKAAYQHKAVKKLELHLATGILQEQWHTLFNSSG
jgi:HD superfamily phosphohydrolase